MICILKSIVLSNGDIVKIVMASRDFVQLLKNVREQLEQKIEAEYSDFDDNIDPDARKELDNLQKARIEAQYREECSNILNAMLNWFRDLMMAIVFQGDTSHLFYKNEADFIVDASKRLTFSNAIANLSAIEDARYQLEQYLQEQNVFERLFVKLARSFR